MSKILGSVKLTEDKNLSLNIVDKVNIADVRKTFRFQGYIDVWSIEDYLKDKLVINIMLNEKSVGYIFLYKSLYKNSLFHSKSYILDYAIKRKYRYQKLGLNALKLLFSKDISKVLDTTRYIAFVSSENTVSVACLEKAGMKNTTVKFIDKQNSFLRYIIDIEY